MNKETNLAEIIERGGIYRGIKGNTPQEVLTDLIGSLPIIPQVPADTLLQRVLEREALMPTGIGKGIAVPHPRNPVIPAESDHFAVLAFLENPVDWSSMDGEKVDTLLLLISSSAKQHLAILSEINFMCTQKSFLSLLKERVQMEEILACIGEVKKQWK